MLQVRDRDFELGLVVSLLMHGTIAFLILGGFIGGGTQFGAPTIYSVTLEGGKALGGIGQVPDEKKQTALAPPKNVQAAPEQAKPETKPEEKKEEPKEVKEKVQDAEVSTAQKKDTPKPIEKKAETKEEKPPAKKEDDKKVKDKPQVKDPNATDVNKKLQQAMQRYLGESTEAGGKGFGAGAVTGGKGMGGGILMPEIGLRYKKLLVDRTKSGWRWYDKSSSIKAEAVFDISASGVISNVRITKSSGNSEFDDSVERAIMKANPLPPPPAEVYEQFFKSVRVLFDPTDL